MTTITLKLNAEELHLLSSLASDQLFRREFIDPKMPGHITKPGEINLGKSLVSRMRAALGIDPAKGTRGVKVAV